MTILKAGSSLIMALMMFGSCAETPQTIRISGSLEGIKTDEVVLCRSKERISYNRWLTTIDTARLSDNGAFSFTVTGAETDFYQVCDMRGYPLLVELYLEPGDTVNVRITKNENGRKTTVEGARAGAYRYYDLLDSTRRDDPDFSLTYRDLAKLPIDSASAQLDTRLRKERALVNAHFDGHPEWQPVAQFAKDQRDYEVLSNYFAYLYYHNYYTNDTFLYLIPDPAYYHFLDSIDLSRSPEYYFWQYSDFLTKYLEDRVERDYAELEDSVYWADRPVLMFETAKKYFTGRTRDAALLALTREFSHALSHPECFDRIAAMEAYFIEHYTSKDLLRKFQHVCREFEVLKPGNIVPDLALPNVHGDTVRLSDLRGKVLYIDFWGTWCYPCLQELPHSLTLEEKLKGENVEFVFIGLESSGEQVEEWKAFIQGERSFTYAPFLEQRVYPGVHLLAEGQFGNPELAPFQINAAPTYMLVDASGRIVAPRASRPSDEKTEGAIREAIKG